MQNFASLGLDIVYGCVIGGALGLTGTGGSILAVPALVYLVRLDVHTGIGTSLAVAAVLGSRRASWAWASAS